MSHTKSLKCTCVATFKRKYTTLPLAIDNLKSSAQSQHKRHPSFLYCAGEKSGFRCKKCNSFIHILKPNPKVTHFFLARVPFFQLVNVLQGTKAETLYHSGCSIIKCFLRETRIFKMQKSRVLQSQCVRGHWGAEAIVVDRKSAASEFTQATFTYTMRTASHSHARCLTGPFCWLASCRLKPEPRIDSGHHHPHPGSDMRPRAALRSLKETHCPNEGLCFCMRRSQRAQRGTNTRTHAQHTHQNNFFKTDSWAFYP